MNCNKYFNLYNLLNFPQSCKFEAQYFFNLRKKNIFINPFEMVLDLKHTRKERGLNKFFEIWKNLLN